MVAMVGAEDSHVTMLVTSCLVPSANMPVAVNCWSVPAAICGLVGVTSITASWKGLILIVMDVPVGRISAVVRPIKLGIEKPGRNAFTSKTLLFPTGTSTVIRPVARSISRTMGVIFGPVIESTSLPMLDGIT
jgi:hypothetical protein